jgi:hypothetical protein
MAMSCGLFCYLLYVEIDKDEEELQNEKNASVTTCDSQVENQEEEMRTCDSQDENQEEEMQTQ